MKYNEALDYINDKDKFGSRLGLESIGKLLELLDNPQDKLKYIHIAGTNGKGSTASYLSNTLIKAGYSVGMFTSPYIERFNERVQVNGKDISDENLGNITARIKEKADIMVEEGYEHPTTFEIVTAIAFMYFKQEDADYVVLEVGLGGRYDSTNIIKSPLVSVITTIDYDHIDVLGDTLEKIAYQKAGIIKEDSLVVSYPQDDEAIRVLREIADEKKSEFIVSPLKNIEIKESTNKGSTFDFSFKGYKIKNIDISMLGEYQVYNASLAITTLLVLRQNGLVDISDEEILEGLKDTKWPGRLEVLDEDPTFLIDGAHNVQGIEQLKRALSLFKYERLILGMAILQDKETSKMIELLAPIADIVVATEVNMPRKLDADELGEGIKKYNENVFVEKDIKKAIEKTIEMAGKRDIIVFGGSLYLIGEVKLIFKAMKN